MQHLLFAAPVSNLEPAAPSEPSDVSDIWPS